MDQSATNPKIPLHKRLNALKHYIRSDGIEKHIFDEDRYIRKLAIEIKLKESDLK